MGCCPVINAVPGVPRPTKDKANVIIFLIEPTKKKEILSKEDYYEKLFQKICTNCGYIYMKQSEIVEFALEKMEDNQKNALPPEKLTDCFKTEFNSLKGEIIFLPVITYSEDFIENFKKNFDDYVKILGVILGFVPEKNKIKKNEYSFIDKKNILSMARNYEKKGGTLIKLDTTKSEEDAYEEYRKMAEAKYIPVIDKVIPRPSKIKANVVIFLIEPSKKKEILKKQKYYENLFKKISENCGYIYKKQNEILKKYSKNSGKNALAPENLTDCFKAEFNSLKGEIIFLPVITYSEDFIANFKNNFEDDVEILGVVLGFKPEKIKQKKEEYSFLDKRNIINMARHYEKKGGNLIKLDTTKSEEEAYEDYKKMAEAKCIPIE